MQQSSMHAYLAGVKSAVSWELAAEAGSSDTRVPDPASSGDKAQLIGEDVSCISDDEEDRQELKRRISTSSASHHESSRRGGTANLTIQSESRESPAEAATAKVRLSFNSQGTVHLKSVSPAACKCNVLQIIHSDLCSINTSRRAYAYLYLEHPALSR